MSAFDDDFAAAENMLAEAFGGDVTYLAGAVEIPWTAQVVLSRHETTNERGVKTTVMSRDYLGDASDLGVTPEEGQRIREGTSVYEVMPVAGAPCWEKADEAGRQIIVRTKEIE